MRRASDEHILVSDVLAGAILEFDSTGSDELRRYPISSPVVGLIDLGDVVLAAVMGAVSGSGQRPLLLRFWDWTLERGGFFPAPTVRLGPSVAGSYGFGMATIAGDEVVAAYSLSDTLYVFTRSGEPVRKIGLELEHWSEPGGPPDAPPMTPAFRAWEERLSRIASVHVVGDRILVQYATERDGAPAYRLACFTRDGKKLFDVADTPRLLTVVGDRLYFVDAESLTEDRWVVASLRR